jgi:hypothetical protein
MGCAAVSTAFADGIGPVQYRWVHPPRFLAATNIPPAGTTQAYSLFNNAQVDVSPTDNQASVTYSKGAFGFPAGQKQIVIGIQPLTHYRAPRKRGLALDGNVYGLSFRFLPSGAAAAHGLKPMLISMYAPHTPVSMVGRVGRRWRTLCNQKTLFLPGPTVNCYTKLLPSELTLLYRPFRNRTHRHRKHHKASTIPIPIIIALVIVVIWAATILFLITRRGDPSDTVAKRSDE